MIGKKGEIFTLFILVALSLLGYTFYETTQSTSCTPNWQCSDWSSCINGQQTRTCGDLNNCNQQSPIKVKTCGTSCTPSCLNKDCGDNGCGGSCGTCQSEYYCEINQCIKQQTGTYTFSYPQDKLNGYYSVITPYCPTIYCNSCLGEKNLCNYDPGGHFTGINQGYTESFTYTSDYPIYGAWQIREFDDFRNKCFVGDCNQGNIRYVLCIDDEGNIDIEPSICNKWQRTWSSALNEFCINGVKYGLGGITPQLNINSLWENMGSCKKPKTINIYMLYSSIPPSDWMIKYGNYISSINLELSKYNIHLTPTYYAYKTSVAKSVDPSHPAYKDGDIHLTLFDKSLTSHPGATIHNII